MLWVFCIGFAFSFIGTIPPGSINLSAIQLGLENKFRTAIYFSLSASLMEYPYAWIAVEFESYIAANTHIANQLQWMGSCVMLILGFFNFWELKKAKEAVTINTANYGFTKGLVLAILNPLAVPFWLGVTTYLRSSNLIVLSDSWTLHAYLFGIICGTFSFLVLAARLAKWLGGRLHQQKFIYYIPGTVLILLGCYGLILYIVER